MSKVGIIMGSKSDLPVVESIFTVLKEFEVEFDVVVSSAHRTPESTSKWTKSAEENDISVIIAIAGAAAHLAGVVASETNIPVIAVPVSATTLGGLDALLSMVQMPGGIPVATMAIGNAGAKNAAIYACQIMGTSDPEIKQKLHDYRIAMKEKVAADNQIVQDLVNS